MIVDRARARAFGPPSREDGWDGSSGHDSQIVQLVSLRRNVPLRLPALRMGWDRNLIMIAGRRGLGTAVAGSLEEVVFEGRCFGGSELFEQFCPSMFLGHYTESYVCAFFDLKMMQVVLMSCLPLQMVTTPYRVYGVA